MASNNMSDCMPPFSNIKCGSHIIDLTSKTETKKIKRWIDVELVGT